MPVLPLFDLLQKFGRGEVVQQASGQDIGILELLEEALGGAGRAARPVLELVEEALGIIQTTKILKLLNEALGIVGSSTSAVE